MLENTKTGPGRITSILIEKQHSTGLKLSRPADGLPLLAQSETRFFHPVQDVQIAFIQNANGQVEMTLRFNGREFHAKKIK